MQHRYWAENQMKLAIFQPVADDRSRQCPYRDDIATLAAALRARHHNVTLIVMDSCDDTDLTSFIATTRPELVLIYVDSLSADLAFRIAGVIDQVHGSPLIPFGPHASLAPDDCLSMRGAEAVAVGPADLTIPRYLALRINLDHVRASGLWVKCETGIMRNPPPAPPESLAGEPLPARDLYDFEKVIDSAGFVQVRAARGGEGGASIAPGAQPPMTGWPATAAWPVLHRPVEAVIEEMAAIADAHIDLVGFRVGNERWTANLDWLGKFAETFKARVGLPLRTTLYAPDVTTESATILAQAGCEEVRVQVGSGSALMRNEMLGLAFQDAAAEAAFVALHMAGIPSVACVEVGAPYETRATLDQTVNFLKRLRPDRVEARLHFPAPGTNAWKASREHGWLVPDLAAAHLAGRPALALPRITADEQVTACETMPYSVLKPMTAHLIRLGRRVRIGRRGTMYDLVVKPFLSPPVRRRKS
jgi:radical SAM superfamily enzyme YgiQ (UPF0313 family)